MADSLLSSLLSAAKWKITNEDYGTSLWTKLGVIFVEIMSDAQVVSQPLSNQDYTGSSVYQNLLTVDLTNGKILRPVKLRMTALCSDLSTLENIITAFVNPTSTFSVTSKSIVSDAMLFSDLTITHDSEKISASTVVMEFEQWTPDANESYNPDGSYNASNYGVRIQSLSTVNTSSISSTVSSLTSSATALYSKVLSAITS
jgi:hypothetical protein